MKSLIYSILIVLTLPITSSAQDWKVTADIEKVNDKNILEGYIDSTYKIKMVYGKHKQPYYCDDTAGMAVQWLNRTISGWYSYEQIGEKIPLIGSYNPSDGENYIRLFVPQNYTDTISIEDCDLDSFREVFYNETHHKPINMLWYMAGSQDTLPVNLTYVQKEGPRTIANLTLYFYGWAIKSLSLSELSEQDYIMNIWHLDFKQVKGKYYMTFKFTEPAVPGGSGGGAGGMDFNTFLGHIELDKDLNLVNYEQKLYQRGALLLEEYEIVEGKPELGLVKKEE